MPILCSTPLTSRRRMVATTQAMTSRMAAPSRRGMNARICASSRPKGVLIPASSRAWNTPIRTNSMISQKTTDAITPSERSPVPPSACASRLSRLVRRRSRRTMLDTILATIYPTTRIARAARTLGT